MTRTHPSMDFTLNLPSIDCDFSLDWLTEPGPELPLTAEDVNRLYSGPPTPIHPHNSSNLASASSMDTPSTSRPLRRPSSLMSSNSGLESLWDDSDSDEDDFDDDDRSDVVYSHEVESTTGTGVSLSDLELLQRRSRLLASRSPGPVDLTGMGGIGGLGMVDDDGYTGTRPVTTSLFSDTDNDSTDSATLHEVSISPDPYLLHSASSPVKPPSYSYATSPQPNPYPLPPPSLPPNRPLPTPGSTTSTTHSRKRPISQLKLHTYHCCADDDVEFLDLTDSLDDQLLECPFLAYTDMCLGVCSTRQALDGSRGITRTDPGLARLSEVSEGTEVLHLRDLGSDDDNVSHADKSGGESELGGEVELEGERGWYNGADSLLEDDLGPFEEHERIPTYQESQAGEEERQHQQRAGSADDDVESAESEPELVSPVQRMEVPEWVETAPQVWSNNAEERMINGPASEGGRAVSSLLLSTTFRSHSEELLKRSTMSPEPNPQVAYLFLQSPTPRGALDEAIGGFPTRPMHHSVSMSSAEPSRRPSIKARFLRYANLGWRDRVQTISTTGSS